MGSIVKVRDFLQCKVRSTEVLDCSQESFLDEEAQVERELVDDKACRMFTEALVLWSLLSYVNYIDCKTSVNLTNPQLLLGN